MSEGNGGKGISNRFEFTYRFVKDIGFPAVVVCVLLYGIGVFGDRMTTAYVDTLKVVNDAVIRQSTAMERVSTLLGDQERADRERTDLIRSMIEEQKKTTRTLEEIRNGNLRNM